MQPCRISFITALRYIVDEGCEFKLAHTRRHPRQAQGHAAKHPPRAAPSQIRKDAIRVGSHDQDHCPIVPLRLN